MYLLFAAIGSIIGSIIFDLDDYRVLVTALVCAAISAVSLVRFNKHKEKIHTLLAFVLVMFFNYNFRAEHLEYIDLAKYLNTNQTIEFKIVSPVKEEIGFQSEFIVEIKHAEKSIINSFKEIFIPYRFLAKTNSSKALSQGDIVKINSKLEFEKLSYYQGKKYKKDKVFYKLKTKDIEFQKNSFSPFSDLRKKVRRYYIATLGKEKADICSSLLFGSRIIELPKSLSNAIRSLGLGHFFAASGFHLVVLVGFITFILNRFKYSPVLNSSINSVIALIYSGLAGFSPSIVRALICVLAYFLVSSSNRKLNSINLITLLAGIVIFIDPYTIFDLGFQFSYLATIALLIWAQVISKRFTDFKNKILSDLTENKIVNNIASFITETLAVSLSVQIFLAPISIYYFKSFPIWGILANLFFTPILSLVIVTSFLGLSFIISPLLDLVLYIFKLSKHLPFIHTQIELHLGALSLLFILLSLIALDFAYPHIKEKLPEQLNYLKAFENSYFRKALNLSILCFLLAKTLPVYSTYSYEIRYGKFDKLIYHELQNLKKTEENFKYFQLKDLNALIIKDLSSLKKLNGLLDNLKEVHVLILPKLRASDIYLDTLVRELKPQFIFTSTRSHSEKVKHNLKTLALNSNLIINEGKLVISDRKYWKIYE